MIRASLVVLGALALAACGGEREGAASPRAADAPVAPPEASAAEAPPEPEPMDSAEVARAIAEDDALEAANRATYEQRRRSMSSYDDCMRQARELPEQARTRIEAACEARRDDG